MVHKIIREYFNFIPLYMVFQKNVDNPFEIPTIICIPLLVIHEGASLDCVEVR